MTATCHPAGAQRVSGHAVPAPRPATPRTTVTPDSLRLRDDSGEEVGA